MLTNIKNQITALAPDAFRELIDWVNYNESPRRDRARSTEAGAINVIEELRAAEVIAAPDPDDPRPWQDPCTIHTEMYLRGDRVTHAGKVWVSTHAGLNHWEPGAAGIDYRIWEEVVDEPDDGEGESDVQAWREGLVLAVDDLVAYDGKTWRVVQAHTSQAHWLPDALPALYEAVAE